MSQLKKIAVMAVTCGGTFAASLMPAQALSIITPVSGEQAPGAVAAFAEATSNGNAANASLLSVEEIARIKWCAERYRSYHASDNSYAGAGGSRTQCRAPH